MKTPMLFFVILHTLVASVISAATMEFSSLSARTKNYVVENLSDVVRDHEILLVKVKHDLLYSLQNKAHLKFISMFSLFEAINVAELKTPRKEKREKYICLDISNFSFNKRFTPWISRKENCDKMRMRCLDTARPYLPTIISPDEYVRLVFAESEPDWNTDELDLRFVSMLGTNEIPKDVKALSPKELIEANGESEFFSTRVVRLDSFCVFQVDATAPQVTKDEIVWDCNIKNIEGIRARAREECNLIHLSHTEVSEIVYLAYRLKGYKEGRSEYKNACTKNPKILKPVEKLQTEIGKLLAIELYPKGLIEFRAEEKK